MLSGNRNFEARIHPEVKANYLASPPLVVAYALAGRMDVDLNNEPLQGDVFLRDLWPTSDEIQETIATAIHGEMYTSTYADVFTGDEQWRTLPVPEGDRFAWDPASTYVRRPTYVSREQETGEISGARCLVSLADSVTTDHISPAGAIRPDSPAGRYLIEHGVERVTSTHTRAARQPRSDDARHVRERAPAQPAQKESEGTDRTPIGRR